MTMTGAPRYKAALAAFMVAFPGVSLAEKVAGLNLPDGARRIGENRYQVDRKYDEALSHFRTALPPGKYPRRTIAEQAGMKAVHIENPEAKPGSWEGLNLYEVKGETRIFILVKTKS